MAFTLPRIRPSAGSRPVPGSRGRHAASFPAAVFFLLFLLGLAAGPASAHDELSSSNPAANAALSAVPPTVELTFSSVPSGIGATVQVLDGAGEDWADGPARIIDNRAVQAVRAGAPAGAYTVNWRVVSSDSHPIEGVLEFSADAGASAAPDAAGTAVPIEPVEDSGEAAPTAGVSDFPWSIIAMIVVLLALAAALGLTARKRLRQAR